MAIEWQREESSSDQGGTLVADGGFLHPSFSSSSPFCIFYHVHGGHGGGRAKSNTRYRGVLLDGRERPIVGETSNFMVNIQLEVLEEDEHITKGTVTRVTFMCTLWMQGSGSPFS